MSDERGDRLKAFEAIRPIEGDAKAIRWLKFWTQADLAVALGISQQAVALIEGGKREMSKQTRILLDRIIEEEIEKMEEKK